MAGATRLVLVRHGETEWSRDGRHTSRTDLPLTDAGREAAGRLGPALARLDLTAVRSSPRRRALDTCALAGLGDRVEVDEDLVEWDYGEYEGRRTAEIREERPGWTIWTGGAPGGETAEQVAARCDRAIERAIGRAPDGGDVVLFAHAHVLRVLAARWLGQDPAFGARLVLGAATISVLGHERETRVIDVWNRAP